MNYPKNNNEQYKTTCCATEKYKFYHKVSWFFLTLHEAEILHFTDFLSFHHFHPDQYDHIAEESSKGASYAGETPSLKQSHSLNVNLSLNVL